MKYMRISPEPGLNVRKISSNDDPGSYRIRSVHNPYGEVRLTNDIHRVYVGCVTKKGFTNRQLILKQLYRYSTIK